MYQGEAALQVRLARRTRVNVRGIARQRALAASRDSAMPSGSGLSRDDGLLLMPDGQPTCARRREPLERAARLEAAGCAATPARSVWRCLASPRRRCFSSIVTMLRAGAAGCSGCLHCRRRQLEPRALPPLVEQPSYARIFRATFEISCITTAICIAARLSARLCAVAAAARASPTCA